MITAHQPKVFDSSVSAAISSRVDGNIRYPPNDPDSAANLRAWCEQLDVPVSATVGALFEYGDDHGYADIRSVDAEPTSDGACDERGWVSADALVTQQLGLALVLPVADCSAVIFYDPNSRVLGLAHIGWHATINNLAEKMVEYLVSKYDSTPSDIGVYFSPSIRRESYIFDTLQPTADMRWHQSPYATSTGDGRYMIDLLAYNLDGLARVGVDEKNIEISPIDTYTSSDYPSHRRSVHAGTAEERFAVLAMLG